MSQVRDGISFEVIQTPNGNWHVVAYCPRRIRGAATFATRKDADEWIASCSSQWVEASRENNANAPAEGSSASAPKRGRRFRGLPSAKR